MPVHSLFCLSQLELGIYHLEHGTKRFWLSGHQYGGQPGGAPTPPAQCFPVP